MSTTLENQRIIKSNLVTPLEFFEEGKIYFNIEPFGLSNGNYGASFEKTKHISFEKMNLFMFIESEDYILLSYSKKFFIKTLKFLQGKDFYYWWFDVYDKDQWNYIKNKFIKYTQ